MGSHGGQTRKEQLGTEDIKKWGAMEDRHAKRRLQQTGTKRWAVRADSAHMDKSGRERAAKEAIEIGESKFRTH